MIGLKEKIIVTDIDGTLAHRDRIPEEVVKSCGLLRAKGWTMHVATGRILAAAVPHALTIKALSPAIVYDGARVMGIENGVVFTESKLSGDVLSLALERIWDMPVMLQLFGDELVYCRPEDVKVAEYFRSIGVPVKEELLSPGVEGEYFRGIVYGPPPEVEKARRALEKVLEGLATITMAGESFLDILPPGVSKGSALDWYLGSLKHRPQVVVAVGDHLNDCELLDRADIAVSMEDAPPMLKQKADIILPPASEGGFRKLPEYLLDQSFVQDLMFSRHAPEKGRGLVPVEKNKEGLC